MRRKTMCYKSLQQNGVLVQHAVQNVSGHSRSQRRRCRQSRVTSKDLAPRLSTPHLGRARGEERDGTVCDRVKASPLPAALRS
ncbi:hypothetical protein PoB_007647700 [Plakobranchus ocellatus]|uniref:Uncharacterized protein n=1 Tax=Plakobranchus ocellatus TaxID=259542 RepID=A0AAV4E0Z6_9GAST|nr:hypothetical protein PoB_007647700 [Plakobranchus ocellatus]